MANFIEVAGISKKMISINVESISLIEEVDATHCKIHVGDTYNIHANESRKNVMRKIYNINNYISVTGEEIVKLL